MLQRIELFSTRGEDGCRRHSRVFSIRVRIRCLGDLRVNISGFIFLANSFKAARFEIARRKRHGRLLRSGGRTMKKRECRRVIFVCERHLCEGERCRPGELAIPIIIEHFL
jgi:hypothetical protein